MFEIDWVLGDDPLDVASGSGVASDTGADDGTQPPGDGTGNGGGGGGGSGRPGNGQGRPGNGTGGNQFDLSGDS